jgi:hypothetical protein
MARRPSTQNPPDPFDDEFDDLPDSKVESSRMDPLMEDVDYDALTEPVGLSDSVTREPVGVGQIIGGALQVIVQAVIVLVVFLAIGFGVVFAGQRIGIVPMRAATVANVSPEVSVLPTLAVAEAPVIVPTATLSPGEILNCPGAATWWNSQQVQDSYTYFTTTAMEEARASNRIPALMENMRIRRNFVANTPMDACAEEVRVALLRAFDATIEAARAIGASDEAALFTQLDNVNAAYADMQGALARVGIPIETVTVS